MTPSVSGIAHRAAFAGTIEFAPYEPHAGEIVVSDVDELDPNARHAPTDAAVNELLRQVSLQRPSRLIAAGDGALLDVAKRARTLLPTAIDLVLLPNGSEPWRAFAPFTSLYDGAGRRTSRKADVGTTARVLIDGGALEQRAPSVVALHRADTLAQAVEVSVSRATQPWDRTLALSAIRQLSDPSDVAGVIAAGLTVMAFAAPGLGLAHAAASPLGALSRRTHDVPNVILAPRVVRHWGESVDWREVADALEVPASSESVADHLDGYRQRAGLPRTLAEAGFDRPIRAAAAERAMHSSGIPWLPGPVTAGQIHSMLEV